jgi:quercetin dioxygenase-like cupin family protein
MCQTKSNPLERKYKETNARLDEVVNNLHKQLSIDMGDWSYYVNKSEYVEIETGVFSKLCEVQKDDETILDVVFLEGASLKRHKHPHNFEKIFVLSGSLYDSDTQTTIREGDIYNINKDIYHSIYSENGCRCKVFFKPKMI